MQRSGGCSYCFVGEVQSMEAAICTVYVDGGVGNERTPGGLAVGGVDLGADQQSNGIIAVEVAGKGHNEGGIHT